MKIKHFKRLPDLFLTCLLSISVLISCSEDVTDKTETEAESDTSSFTPLLAYDMEDGSSGSDFLSWKRSVYDNTHVIGGQSIKVTTDPGGPLPECSGNHFYAGKTTLSQDKWVPQGKTIWYRMMFYIPGTFSFGYKYGGEDREEATACDQYWDGSKWLKWLVFSPSVGTARTYLQIATQKRAADDSGEIRIISEALHQPGDFTATLPRNEWFSLQVAMKVSSGDDGFLRAWINDTYLGEVTGRNIKENASVKEWGLGNYWNGVPWTDGEVGRTDFWIDEVIIASDMDGYGAPTGTDSEGHPYIDPDLRVADLR